MVLDANNAAQLPNPAAVLVNHEKVEAILPDHLTVDA